jgi:hypothetical protein
LLHITLEKNYSCCYAGGVAAPFAAPRSQLNLALGLGRKPSGRGLGPEVYLRAEVCAEERGPLRLFGLSGGPWERAASSRAEVGGGGRSTGGLSAALRAPAALLNMILKDRWGSRAGCLVGAKGYAPLGSEGVAKGVEGEALVTLRDVGAMVEVLGNLSRNLILIYVSVLFLVFAVLEHNLSVADIEDSRNIVFEHPTLHLLVD